MYADAAGACGVFRYRHATGRDEFDAVTERGNGAWFTFEGTLGAARVNEAAANHQDDQAPDGMFLRCSDWRGLPASRRRGVLPLTVPAP